MLPPRAGTVRTVTTRRRFWRWALVLIVAAAVVVMHHVVGAHQHGPAVPGAGAVVAHQSHQAHSSAGHGTVAVRDGAPESGSVANLHLHGDGEHHGAGAGGHPAAVMLLHLCLAVLAAAVIITVLVVVALWWRMGALLGPGPWRQAPRTASRAPPVPRRLAQLQVLRL